MRCITLFFFLLVALFGRLQANEVCNCPPSATIKERILSAYENSLEEAITVSREFSGNSGDACKAFIWNTLADLYLKEKRYDDARTALNNVLSLNAVSCLDTQRMGAYFLRGKYWVLTNVKDSATADFIRVLEMAKSLKDSSLLAKSCVNLGVVFNDLEQHEKALHYQQLGLFYTLLMNDSSTAAMIYVNIAATYGMLYEQRNDLRFLDSAELYHVKSLPLARATKNRKALLSGYTLRASFSQVKGEYKLCIAYCDSALSLARRGADDRTYVKVYNKLSMAYGGLKDFERSAFYADSALYYAEKIGQVDQVVTALDEVINANSALGKYELAFRALLRKEALSDSLESVERMEAVTELEQKYNKARNEEEITRLNHEAEVRALRINILVLGVFVLLVILGGILVLFRQRTLKNKQIILETEQRLNRARMNPHFFFNALTSLQTYALKPGNSDKVPLYLARYSKIMRQTLESTYNELNPLSEEIDFIRGYLDMQKLMHPGKFDYVIEYEEVEDELEDLSMPSMIVQPFIENSVEHGFRQIEYPGEIRIVFRKRADGLVLTISDNGSSVGVSSKHEGYPSRATQIISDRLFLLDRTTGKSSSFTVGNNNEGKGYLVTITLPLIKT